MQLHSATDLDGSVELDDLDRAVLWAMRSVAVGRADCPSLRRTFYDLYGPAADQILCGLLVMVRLLGVRSAEGFRLHMPGCSAVSRDEVLILAALAAVQDEGLSDARAAADAGLVRLVGGPLDASLSSALRYVAELLSDRGRRLSRPDLAPCTGADVARRRTIH
ncbi:hypothetical protein LJR225_000470 [Phenylobacterium sp. LjRoot225]|uniref:hypothetical protein n=1 Tax=Phenylobacterium sp. LjRoot225 TaxID=3342285 RepID=UPI003ECE437D